MRYDVSTFTLPSGTRASRVVGTGTITKEDAAVLTGRFDPGGDIHGMPMLVLTGQMKEMTPEARSIFSSPHSEERPWVAVVGASPLIWVTVNFLLRVSKHVQRLRMFSAEPEVIAWLDERAREMAAQAKTAT